MEKQLCIKYDGDGWMIQMQKICKNGELKMNECRTVNKAKFKSCHCILEFKLVTLFIRNSALMSDAC